jgi:hypothetical protein
MSLPRMCGSLTLTLALLFSRESRADSIRCGDQLASTGASLYEVKATCGTPDDAMHRIEQRTVVQQLPGPCVKTQGGRSVCGSSVTAIVEVVVDEWTYDFGRERFITYLKFEDGRLIQIRDGGYGKKAP